MSLHWTSSVRRTKSPRRKRANPISSFSLGVSGCFSITTLSSVLIAQDRYSFLPSRQSGRGLRSEYGRRPVIAISAGFPQADAGEISRFDSWKGVIQRNGPPMKRLVWLDIAKGLAILWVVYFHFFKTY